MYFVILINSFCDILSLKLYKTVEISSFFDLYKFLTDVNVSASLLHKPLYTLSVTLDILS